MTDFEKELLITMIDIEQVVRQNDLEATKVLVEKLNSKTLETSIANSLNESLNNAIISEIYYKADAYRYLVNNAKFITEKGYKLKLLEILEAMHQPETKDRVHWLEENAIEALTVTEPHRQYEIAKMLINMCSKTKSYDVMELIRQKIVEA